jgi:hypothetical protein
MKIEIPPTPKGITVIDDATAAPDPGYRDAPRRRPVTVIRRWFSAMVPVLAAFCVLWDGFLFFWYRSVTGGSLVFQLVPVIHVIAGLVMTYLALAGFLNRTTIRLTPDELVIRHGPLPFPGNVRLAADDIAQIRCDEQVAESKNGTSRSYRLIARRKSGEPEVRLLSLLHDPDQAYFLQEILRDRLGLARSTAAGDRA